jgi:uncharacterized protein (TIGR02453 family)
VAFGGWPAEAVEFYEGLEADNSKAYWQDNKGVYDRCVRGPMDELLAELAPEFGPAKVFRPNRDVRFSADKSPYKTHCAALLERGGYVQLSSAGLGVGNGYFHMAADQLDRFRRAVAHDATGPALEQVLASVQAGGAELIAHDVLKTAPKNYDRDHPRVALLRHKGLAVWRSWPPAAWLGTKGAKARVAGFLHASQPVSAWLDAHVGPSR